jgi:hypothetical protein
MFRNCFSRFPAAFSCQIAKGGENVKLRNLPMGIFPVIAALAFAACSMQNSGQKITVLSPAVANQDEWRQ